MSTSHDLADRYGTPSRHRRSTLVGVSVLLALVCGGWLGWTIWEQSRPLVASGELTYEIVDGNSAVARFTVDLREDDVEASCTLRALAADKAAVGEVTFDVDPGAGGRVEHEIRTERRATAVELLGCRAPGQSRYR